MIAEHYPIKNDIYMLWKIVEPDRYDREPLLEKQDAEALLQLS
ncbi:hypothetical protein MY3296_007929 [Beauveria thailandica]